MQALLRFDGFLKKYMAFLPVTCLALGILLAPWLGGLSPIVPYAFMGMTFISSLGSGFGDLKHVLLRPLPLIVALLVLHMGMPLIAFGVGSLFFPDDIYFVAGILLEFVIPTAVVGMTWVAIYGGNTVLTLSMLLVDTFVTPFLTPLMMRLLLHSSVAMDSVAMMRDMLLMIALPAFAAMLCNHVTKNRAKTDWAPKLSPFGKMCLITTVTVNASRLSPFVRNLSWKLVGVAAVIALLVVMGYTVGFLMSRLLRADFPDTVSLTICSGLRNISAGAVLAGQYFPAETMFPVVIGELFQQIAVAFAGLLLTKIRPKIERGEKVHDL